MTAQAWGSRTTAAARYLPTTLLLDGRESGKPLGFRFEFRTARAAMTRSRADAHAGSVVGSTASDWQNKTPEKQQ